MSDVTSIPPLKQCATCPNSYPATTEYFRPNKSGLRSVCRQCDRDNALRLYYEKRDLILEQKRLDRIANPDKYKERDRKRLIEHHDKELLRFRDYHNRHKEKRNKESKEWRENNPDRMRHNNVVFYYANQESQKQRSRVSYTENKPRYIMYSKKAHAKRRTIMQNLVTDWTHADLQKLYDEQESMCAYCGIRLFWDVPNDIHADHIHPISKGGSNLLDNICLACADCNLSKKDKTIPEWQAVRGW